MTESRLFSVVVVPSREGHIREAIGSVTGPADDIEIVIAAPATIDLGLDGEWATDGRPPISWLDAPTTSLWQALNEAAQSARGEYLAFLASDDRFHADRLEVFARIARRTPFTWAFSGVTPIDELGREMSLASIAQSELRESIRQGQSPLDALRALPWRNSIWAPGNLLVHRGRFEAIGGFRRFDTHVGWDLALRLLEVEPPYAVDRPLYLARITSNAMRNRRVPRDVQREGEVVLSSRQRRLGARTILRGRPPGEDLAPADRAALRLATEAIGRLRKVPGAYAFGRMLYRGVRRLRG